MLKMVTTFNFIVRGFVIDRRSINRLRSSP